MGVSQGWSLRENNPLEQLKLLRGSLYTVKCINVRCALHSNPTSHTMERRRQHRRSGTSGRKVLLFPW
ncbi:hypothetical protein GQ44DRAFT_712212 [Phaeosphaeriaceae sp. PMI808]|nr:hypothetical protein GQ44DRAFT_712212 [Phaeosphaeriaceae sp. PMI808]